MLNVKVIVKKAGKKGLGSLQIEFYIKKVNRPLIKSVGYSINPYFLKNSQVTAGEINYIAINKRINTIIANMQAAYSSLLAENVEVDRDNLNSRYTVIAGEETKLDKVTVSKMQELLTNFALEEKAELTTKIQKIDNELVEYNYKTDGKAELLELYAKFEKHLDNQVKKKKKIKEQSLTPYVYFKKCFFIDFPNSKLFKDNKLNYNLESINEEFWDVYTDYLKSTNTITKKEENKSNSKVFQRWKCLRAFITYLDTKNYKVNREYLKFEHNYKNRENNAIAYLTDSDLELLEEYRELIKQKKRRQMCDVILFQNYTGLRISDCLKEHTLAQDTEEAGVYWLMGKAVKTNNDYCIQVDKKILDILERNNYSFANVVYNSLKHTIKTIIEDFCKHYNIHQTDTYLNRFRNEVPFWEAYQSHDGRRGNISRNIQKGVSLAKLSVQLGSNTARILEKSYIDAQTKSLQKRVKNTL